MSIALIGTSVIQMYWIKWSVSLDAKNFDDKVVMALNRVKDRLDEDAKALGTNKDFWKSRTGTSGSLFNNVDEIVDNTFSIKGRSTLSKQKLNYELSKMSLILAPDYMLENINRDNLNTYLSQEFKNQNIDLSYDYGVYSNSSDGFFIVNGNYVAQIGDESRASKGEENLNSTPAEYQIDLFSTDSNVPGHLKIFFPTKNSWLWSSVRGTMLGSILFTGLILFCFSYTLYIILRQKKISEMKTDFINNMTHEFKTPIATISLAADSITSPVVSGSESKIKRFADIIKQENKRMLNQVEKVLQMAKIEKEDTKLNVSEFDINEVVSRAAENINLRVTRREGSVKLDLKSMNSLIEGDHNHISNVLNNLLDNAEKYTKGAPHIIIGTKDIKKGVEIFIKDNGIGMSKESQKHIFERFFRVHTGNVHDVKGFGLGLSYVKAMVDAHDGKIRVKSELGKGTTFFIQFPSKHLVTK